MVDVDEGRGTAGDEDVVVFLIGMRINRLRSIRSWMPAVSAMPRMLRELSRDQDLGLLDARTYVSGRVLLVVQYWRSFEHLDSYARAGDREHLPAWRAFNVRARAAGPSVGIFHETYLAPASGREAVYVGMPRYGLAKATSWVPITPATTTARRRMGV